MCSSTSKPQRSRKDACRLLLMIPKRANPIRWTCCWISQAKATGAAEQSEGCIKRGFSKPIVLVWNWAVPPGGDDSITGMALQNKLSKKKTPQRQHRGKVESFNEKLEITLECESCSVALKITHLHSKIYFLHRTVNQLLDVSTLFQNSLSLMVPPLVPAW